MEINMWYETFLGALHEKYPKNTQLTSELMNLLYLEREATYRRLKKDVSFTANEIAKVATTWNISLDEIIGINSGQIRFQMFPLNYLNPSPKDFENLQKIVSMLNHLLTDRDSQYVEISNILPKPFLLRFPTLLRFKIFNWAYHYHTNELQKLFSQIIIPDHVCAEFERYKSNIVHVKNSSFILDEMIFEYLVQNINYFHSILVVTDEEKERIKEELHALLDYMAEIANKGCYPETYNKVNLYISQIAIDTSYSYFDTDTLKTCSIHAFGKFDISSYDLNMVASFQDWMNAKKRSSIQISEVNEKKRIEFFGRQREVVEGL